MQLPLTALWAACGPAKETSFRTYDLHMTGEISIISGKVRPLSSSGSSPNGTLKIEHGGGLPLFSESSHGLQRKLLPLVSMSSLYKHGSLVICLCRTCTFGISVSGKVRPLLWRMCPSQTAHTRSDRADADVAFRKSPINFFFSSTVTMGSPVISKGQLASSVARSGVFVSGDAGESLLNFLSSCLPYGKARMSAW